MINTNIASNIILLPIYILLVLLFWLYFSTLVGTFARHRRNRFGLGYFLLALVFSPLLTFMLVACLRTMPARTAKPYRWHKGMPGWRDNDLPAPTAPRDPRWAALRATSLEDDDDGWSNRSPCTGGT